MTPTDSAWCVRCLAPAQERQLECSVCQASFRGAGSYDLMLGAAPPSRPGSLRAGVWDIPLGRVGS